MRSPVAPIAMPGGVGRALRFLTRRAEGETGRDRVTRLSCLPPLAPGPGGLARLRGHEHTGDPGYVQARLKLVAQRLLDLKDEEVVTTGLL